MNYYAIIYANGSADLDSLTLSQKQSIVDRYVPDNVINSNAWQNASNAVRWNYVKDNIIPASLKRKISKYGVLPILYHETKGFELFQNWWLLAKEGAKYCILAYIDYDKNLVPFKNWLDTQSGCKYWYARDVWGAFRNLWNDRQDSVALAIIKRVIRYPVEKEIEGKTIQVMVTVQEAIDLGYTIETSILVANKKKIIPIKVLGQN